MLLLPLETVKQDPRWHPEGDALYHSLQVFQLAGEALPYDEEFQTAALLHDVGKAIDPREHVAAALEALDGYITPRTAWFIEHHMEAAALYDGTLVPGPGDGSRPTKTSTTSSYSASVIAAGVIAASKCRTSRRRSTTCASFRSSTAKRAQCRWGG